MMSKYKVEKQRRKRNRVVRVLWKEAEVEKPSQ